LNVNESMSQRERYYENNVLGTLNLLGEMMNHQVRRMVFSSSCAIHGNPPSVPITEDMPKEPISPYGRTKWVVEMALQDCAASDGLGSISLRYFNAAGASEDGTIGEDRDPEYHLIPLILQVPLKQRKKIFVFGSDYPTPDGTCVRDYIHVLDIARAHNSAIDNIEEGRAEAYNVGTGKGYSVLEVIEAAREVTQHPIPAEQTDRREGDPAELYADASAIRKRLGWEAKYTNIKDIVKTAWDWHQTHPRGYDE